ncbi:MAG: hypothetical protein ACI4EO_01830 [Blautia sp.]
MKKSLEEAMNRAKQMSVEHPDIAYAVMDKKRKRAVVTSCGFVLKERILEGWTMVAKFKNGKEV